MPAHFDITCANRPGGRLDLSLGEYVKDQALDLFSSDTLKWTDYLHDQENINALAMGLNLQKNPRAAKASKPILKPLREKKNEYPDQDLETLRKALSDERYERKRSKIFHTKVIDELNKIHSTNTKKYEREIQRLRSLVVDLKRERYQSWSASIDGILQSSTSDSEEVDTKNDSPSSNRVAFSSIGSPSPSIGSPSLSSDSSFFGSSTQLNVTPERNIIQGQPGKRKSKSLEVLCDRFLSVYSRQSKGDLLSLENVAKVLGYARRRVYDVVNILECVNLVSRRGRNMFQWNGYASLASELSSLQKLATKVVQQSPEKRESLVVISRRFIIALLASETGSIDWETAKKIIDANKRKTINAVNVPGVKPKKTARRLYDIGNVLNALGLVMKHRVNKNLVFVWCGLPGVIETHKLSPDLLQSNGQKRSRCGSDKPQELNVLKRHKTTSATSLFDTLSQAMEITPDQNDKLDLDRFLTEIGC